MTERTVLVRLKANVGDFVAGMGTARAAVAGIRNEIDTTNDRTAWLAQSILALGPTLAPLGAAAVPLFAGLAAQVGVTAGAVGVLALVFNGLGDGLKALNDYQLEPTEEHLTKLQQTMSKIGPEGEDFVRFLDSLGPALRQIQFDARGEALPGFQEGIESAIGILPEARSLVLDFADALGQLASEAGEGIASERMEDFFGFLERQGKPLLLDLGYIIGNLMDTLGNLFVGFEPLIEDFSSGFLAKTREWAEATDSLDTNTGFQSFLVYVQESIPKVNNLLGSLVDTLVAITQAAAPVGDLMLTILPPILDIVTQLADTPLGSMFLLAAAAMSVYGRAVALASITTGGLAKAVRELNGATEFQLRDVRLLPTAYRQVTLAQKELAVAQAEQNKARITYIGQLQAQNRLQSQGYVMSAGATARLQDSLGRLELANHGVMGATERANAAEKERRALLRGTTVEAGKAGAAVAGLALITSGMAEDTGLANTASLALMGTMVGPYGAAFGAAIGFTLDLAHATDGAEESIRNINAAMAASDSTALSQSLETARKQLEGLREGEDKQSLLSPVQAFMNVDSVMGQIDGTTDKLSATVAEGEERLAQMALAEQRVAAGATAAINPLDYMAKASQRNAEASQQEAAALQEAVDAMRAKRQETLRALNAELNYEAALDDASKAIKDNGKDFRKTTEEGRANRAALYGIADAWNQQSDAAKNAKGSLRASRAAFIETARAMGASREEARRLANQLYEIPTKRQIDVYVDTHGADAELRALQGRMDQLHGKTLDVYTNVHPVGGQVPAPSADGGAVPKSGQPYADRYLYMLADGEQIISNRYGQADRFRADQAAGRIPGYADGGTAGSRRAPSQAGNHGSRPFDAVGDSVIVMGANLKELNRLLAETTKSLDKEKAARDAVASQIADVKGGVASGLRSNIFDTQQQSTSPWAMSHRNPTDATSILNADTARAEEFTQIIQSLAAKGLKGAALAELINGPNGPDIERARAYNALSAADLAAYSAAYDRREHALGVAADAAGQATFGAEYAALQGLTREEIRALRDIEKAIKALKAANDKGHKDTKDSADKSGDRSAANARRRRRQKGRV